MDPTTKPIERASAEPSSTTLNANANADEDDDDDNKLSSSFYRSLSPLLSSSRTLAAIATSSTMATTAATTFAQAQ